MERLGEAIRGAALALVGVPFRLHGRSAATGVDCVGLALLAVRGAGVTIPEPPPYRLRTAHAPTAPCWLSAAGFVEADDRRPGDLAIVRVGALQLHLLIDAGDGAVHAHAGLGRVVHSPWPADWAELSRWRMTER
jgi:cell wall-associated NlpC family hydrolase